VERIFELQRTVGNHVVAQLVRSRLVSHAPAAKGAVATVRLTLEGLVSDVEAVSVHAISGGMVISRRMDSASPRIMRAAARGMRIARAELAVRMGSRTAVYALTDCVVHQHATGEYETFTISYASIQVEYLASKS
jgi:hypothetical protein